MLNVEYVHRTFLSNKAILLECKDGEGDELVESYDKNLIFPYSQYLRTGDKEEYIEALDRLSIIETNNRLSSRLGLKKINVPKNVFYTTTQDFTKCECGGFIKISEVDCNMECSKCGTMTRFSGVIANKVVKPNGRSVSLSNNYKHKNYLSQVYRNIFALEKYNFLNTKDDREKFDEISRITLDYCKRYDVSYEFLLCSWIKRKVSDLNKTKWLPHINLLKKEITGYHIPRLTTEEESKFEMYYNIYQDIYDGLFKKGEEKISYMRCEYVIYKIFEQILDHSEKKLTILAHISLPKMDTLVQLDLKYIKICNESSGHLKYTPTSRGRY